MLIPSSSMRLSILASKATLLPSRSSSPLPASLTGRFWKVVVNDEMWVATTVDVKLGLRMYDDLISPMTDGGDEVCEMRLFWVDLDLISLWVVVICWA